MHTRRSSLTQLKPRKDFDYTPEEFYMALDIVTTGKRAGETSEKVRELVGWILYYIRKYSKPWEYSGVRESLIRYPVWLEEIERNSADFSDIGIIAKFKSCVLQDSKYALDLVSLLNRSPISCFVCDPRNNWQATSISPNIRENFGFSPSELLAKDFDLFSIVYLHDRERIRNELDKHIKQFHSREFELAFRIVDKASEIRFVRSKVEVRYDQQGEPIKLFGYLVDTTSEENANQLTDHYFEALNNSAIVQIVNRDGIIEYINGQYEELTGDTRDVIGKPASSMGGKKFHPPEFWQEMWNTILAGKVWRGTIQNPGPKWIGSYFTYTTITPLLDERGEYSKFIAVKFNLTKQIEMSQQLNAAANRLRAILNSTSEWFWTIDENLRIKEVNESFCRLTGYTKDELVGQEIYFLFDEEWQQRIRERAKDIQSTEHRSYRLNLARKDGGITPITLNATTLTGANGEFLEAVAFFNDMSEVVRHEQELHEALIRDPLTQLYNRGYFDKQLDLHFDKVKRWEEECLSLVHFDVDNFKRINDGFWHDMWDKAIKLIWEYLLSISDQNLLAFRYWWDEFVLMGINMSEDDLYEIIERWRKYFEGLKVETTDQKTFRFTISAGVIAYDPKVKERESAERLFKLCDGRLYSAKDSGRNRVFASRDVM